MTIARCTRLPAFCQVSRCLLLPLGRIVIVLAVFVFAVVLALRGHSPEAITGPVLALVAIVVAAADRLVGVQHVQHVPHGSALPTP